MISNKLETKLVGDIKGNFYIPAYQRGYRWKEEVEMLLNDINEIPEGANYCLQPIVVKNVDNNKYELIDGQQRLTTIFLIQRYVQTYRPKSSVKYSIEYEIRDNSQRFLNEMDFENINADPKNIDEFFINEAATIIKLWFEQDPDKADDLASKILDKFNNKIYVIWYEVDSSENSSALFTRLNIGKIPLTNAELIKALFLSRNNGIDDNKQLEIATQWDIIEKELHNDSFWYFITNNKSEKYPTRIELIFDLMADKQLNDKERYRTFFFFSDKIKQEEKKAEIWKAILRYYQKLKEWYENFEVYHKVGYLIATETSTLQNLLKSSENKTKTDFQRSLDEILADSIKLKDKDFSELSYDNKTDYDFITKLLLLFNVETIRQKQDIFIRFPFERHKNKDWSLEHIHAQQSEGLNTNEARKEWIEMHLTSIKVIDESIFTKKEKDKTDLINRMNDILSKIEDKNDKSNIGELFDVIFKDVISVLSEEGSTEYVHSLANMALLSQPDNAALNNSTFDVKRNKILEMDKTSDYIPVCTRRVFLKYYTPSKDNQLHFWGKADRDAYISAMNEILKPYLSIIKKEITL